MSEQIPIVEAFRVMTANKSLSEEELHDLIRDGARRFDGPVDAEIEVQSDGDIRIVVLKEVVEVVEDPAREIRLEEARWDDPDFQVGDLMEIPVDFRESSREFVRVSETRFARSSTTGSANWSPARSSRSSVARWSSFSTGRARPRRSSRGENRTHASASVRASRFAPCSRSWRRPREARG
jgi:hypothetical protein